MAADAVLALNAGSSSCKFALFEAKTNGLEQLCRGAIDDHGDGTCRFLAHSASGAGLADQPAERETAYGLLFDWAEHHLSGRRLVGVGHRVVHGGTQFSGPVRLDERVLVALEALSPLAPLHQPQSLAGIRAVAAVRPDLPQTASFDTAFHHGHAEVVTRFGLPRRLHDEGLRRYGFHGLSYAYLAGRLRGLDPALAAGRVIAAHLGNGASLCVMRDGASLDTTMGLSALDGLVMGTRCGALDPGAVLYLMQHAGLDAAAVSDLLYRQSGLLGVSGLSGDMRALLASDAVEARQAIELFAFRAAREAAALAATAGGLDGLVFTAGIGERAPAIRALICERLAWLGVALDPALNAAVREGPISPAESRVKVWVIPTDEEQVIAADAVAVLGSPPQAG